MPRRALRRRRRARLGAVHGQGRVQGADGAARASPRSTTGRVRERRVRGASAEAALERSGGARAAGVRQAGAARLLGRDRAGRRAPTSSRRALETAFEHDPLAIVEAAATGLRGRVLGARQRRADRLAARARSCSPPARAGWYDYEAKYTPGGMELIVPARGSPTPSRERVRELAVDDVRQSRLLRASRGSTSSSTASRCSSTSSTRCPGSRRRACSGRCSRRAGSRTRSCSTGSWSSRSSATRRSAAPALRARQAQRYSRPPDARRYLYSAISSIASWSLSARGSVIHTR